MMEDKERELKVVVPEFGMSPELRNEIAKVIEQTLGNGQIVIYPKDIEGLTVPESEAIRVRKSVLRVLGNRGFDINIIGDEFQFVSEKEENPREAIGY